MGKVWLRRIGRRQGRLEEGLKRRERIEVRVGVGRNGRVVGWGIEVVLGWDMFKRREKGGGRRGEAESGGI